MVMVSYRINFVKMKKNFIDVKKLVSHELFQQIGRTKYWQKTEANRNVSAGSKITNNEQSTRTNVFIRTCWKKHKLVRV